MNRELMRLSDADILGFIAEANEDEVGLWFIHRIVRDEFGSGDPHVVRQITMDAVERLLHSGAVKAGHNFPDRSGRVRAWNLDPDMILVRIGKKWDELGRDPSVSEVVVFVGKENPRLQ